MKNYCFKGIREEVLRWYKFCISSGAEYIELTKNENEIVVIDLSFNYCLAQIIVCNTTYAPYNKVSFEAATIDSQKAIESGQPELIYFFYDSEYTTIENVIDELNAGVEYCLKYVPDFLETKYKGKKGVILMKGENISKIIHPDDLKKLEKADFNEEYICVDVQFQYLVIKNNIKTIRILPQFFSCV